MQPVDLQSIPLVEARVARRRRQGCIDQTVRCSSSLTAETVTCRQPANIGYLLFVTALCSSVKGAYSVHGQKVRFLVSSSFHISCFILFLVFSFISFFSFLFLFLLAKWSCFHKASCGVWGMYAVRSACRVWGSKSYPSAKLKLVHLKLVTMRWRKIIMQTTNSIAVPHSKIWRDTPATLRLGCRSVMFLRYTGF